jgi:FtsZ-interacting cell division protein ZipA
MKNIILKEYCKSILTFLAVGLIILLVTSCGARKKDSSKTTESTKIESTDKSKIDKSENSESNIKKSQTTTVNNQDQTTTIEETVEPVDPNKEAVFTDSAGKKQSLVNGKKTTKTTVKNNNTKADTKKESTEATKTDKKESEAKDIKAKAAADKKAVEIAVKREAVSLWNLAWLLIPIGLYLVYKNWSRLTAKFKQL